MEYIRPEQPRVPSSNFSFRRGSLLCLSQADPSHWVGLREPAQNTIDNSQVEDKVWVLFHLSSYRLMNSQNSSPRLWQAILFCASCKLNPMHRTSFLRITYYRTRFAKAASSTLAPKMSPKRTTVLLSAFVNYVKFAERYCDVLL